MATMYETELPNSEFKCLIAMRWVGRQSKEIRHKVQEKSQEKYFELKKKHPAADCFVLSDIAFLSAAFIIKVAITKGHDGLPLNVIENLNVRAAKKTRIKPQIKWLSEHQSVIRICIEKGLSSREIAHYLLCESRYKHQVSHMKIIDFIKLKGWKNESA